MKKILVITNSTNGLYSFRKELIEALIKEKCKVTIVSPVSERSAYFKELGCGIVDIKMSNRGTNPIKDLALLLKYGKIVGELKPDIVLTYTVKPNIYAGMVCRLKRIPYLTNVTGLGDSIENNGLLSKLVLCLYRIGIKKAHWVFFQNEYNCSFFRKKKIVSDKCSILPGSGVNLKYHTQKPYPKSDETIDLLFIGRMLKDKGMDELLEIISDIKKNNPNITFSFVGEETDRYYDKIRSMEANNLLKSYGQQLEVRPFLEKCHAVLLPSYHEGTANVLLEAAATGRPVIASNVPGCMETFTESVTGFGCKAKNAKELEKAIISFLQLSHEQKAEMGQAARIKMEKQYDRRFIIDAYMEKINQI